MRAYYNENDPYAANELRKLISAGRIAAGEVDERSIVDVRPDDLRNYSQAHFFAGIGGWSVALRLAGWDDARPVWTGSCPCQPFSLAGKRLGFEDERHLWPEWFRLISERAPSTIFGEQIAHAAEWLSAVQTDLESAGYAFASRQIRASDIGVRHRRNRLWFVANADSQQTFGPAIARPQRHPWRSEPAMGRVVDGIPHRLVEPALRALGNAIVPQVAAVFIAAADEAMR